MMFMKPEDIVARFEKLKAERSNWDSLWQDIADLFLPRKNTFMVKRTEGEERNIQIFDNTGMHSLEIFAGAMYSFLINPNSEWFEFTTGDMELDKRDEVKRFLQTQSRETHNILNNSNFPTEIHELLLDIGGFGTSPMAVEEDDEMIVRFDTKFLGDVCMCENHKGIIDEIYVEFQWTARQIIAKYGEKAVTDKIRQAYAKNTDDKFRVIYCVYPKSYDADQSKVGFPFIAQHILCDEKVTVKKGGFQEFPFVTPRFSKATGEAYGRSPAMNALAEMKVLNEMTMITLEGAQKVIDPPLQSPDDGFILQVNTYPGGMSHYRAGSNDRIEPVFNDSRVDFGFDAIRNSQEKIRAAFYINQFIMGEGPSSVARTATEIAYKSEENFRFLGPMTGRLQRELLRPLINRVSAIRMRKGMVKNIPAILAGKKLDVKFSSLIARMQRQAEAQNTQKFLQSSAAFFQADPSSLQVINSHEGVRMMHRVYGAPQEIIRTEEDVENIQKEMQAAQQAEAQRQEELQNAEAAAKLVPAVAQANNQGA